MPATGMDAKTLCLGVLVMGDATGYEIRKMFEEGPFAHFQDVGYGSIYPALAKLADEGLVSVIEVPENSHSDKRDKKTYRITEAGQRAFNAALAKLPAPDKIRSDTTFLMFFAEFMDPAHLRAVYDDYLAYYRDRAEFLKTLDPEGVPEGRLFVRGMGLAFYEAVADYIAENRSRLIGEEADAAD